MSVVDVILVGGPLDGATERVLTPHPDTLDFYDAGEIVTYTYAGFRDRGFDAEILFYVLSASESIAIAA